MKNYYFDGVVIPVVSTEDNFLCVLKVNEMKLPKSTVSNVNSTHQLYITDFFDKTGEFYHCFGLEEYKKEAPVYRVKIIVYVEEMNVNENCI